MISDNLIKVQDRIKNASKLGGRNPSDVELMVAAKYGTTEQIEELINLGVTHIGENRLNQALRWMDHPIRGKFQLHMIGHLQTNKSKISTKLFDAIDTVDSEKLAEILNAQLNDPLPIMIEVNISGEEQKSGCKVDDFLPLSDFITNKCPNLQLFGVFTMTPVDCDDKIRESIYIRADKLAVSLEDKIKAKVHRCYGMTDDFELAIMNGATLVRIGRAIFY